MSDSQSRVKKVLKHMLRTKSFIGKQVFRNMSRTAGFGKRHFGHAIYKFEIGFRKQISKHILGNTFWTVWFSKQGLRTHVFGNKF